MGNEFKNYIKTTIYRKNGKCWFSSPATNGSTYLVMGNEFKNHKKPNSYYLAFKDKFSSPATNGSTYLATVGSTLVVLWGMSLKTNYISKYIPEIAVSFRPLMGNEFKNGRKLKIIRNAVSSRVFVPLWGMSLKTILVH